MRSDIFGGTAGGTGEQLWGYLGLPLFRREKTRMAKDLLTDAQVRNAKGKTKPYKLADGAGLFLLVQPSGARLWRYKYRIDGKEGLFSIGMYPEKSIADARRELADARELVRQGVHPVDKRNEGKQKNIEAAEARRRDAEGSLEKVSAAWLAEYKSVWAPGTHRAKTAHVARYLLPTLGAIPMKFITVSQIRPILERAKADGAWSAIHVKGNLNSIFEFALQRGLVDNNPIPGLRGLVRIPKSESKAVLSLKQIRDFYTGLKSYRGYPETAMCLHLNALTACRPGEAADAEWSEIDWDAKLWRRPAEKMKARREHISPLSEQAVDLLRSLRAISGHHRYIFPHRLLEDTFATPARMSYAMRDLNLGKGATPHCWRTTFSTWANESGFRPDAIERQLAHQETNRVRATYNKSLLIEERRRMMQSWADYLTAAQSDNVLVVKFGLAG